MDRVAVFIDAGYLFAQGSVLLAGKKLPRGEIVLDALRGVEALQQFAERVSGLKLLRIYWYDGTSTGPTSQHIALAYLPGVKVRLGFVNSVGEQKGVDSLIVTDMIALARNRAMAEAVLLSGDEDLRVGVQQAQEFGVRIHLLGIKPSRGSQSVFLLQEADSTHEWAEAELSPFLTCRMPPESPEEGPKSGPEASASVSSAAGAPSATGGKTEALVGIASVIANEVPASELSSLIASVKATGRVPAALDGRLLARARASNGKDLDTTEKRRVRAAFISALETRLTEATVAKVLEET